MENNKTYEAACAKANAAYQTFDAIRTAYRAGTVDDDTFLAARAVHEAAKAEYDAAFAAASDIETSDARDESDYIDIIEGAKAAWFEVHPEVDTPTTEDTDEAINKALGLNPSGSLRGLENDLAEMTNAEISECVSDGLDSWLVSITNKCEECSETFLEGHGFCGDDMVLCAACALKYAEEHPDQTEATGRSF